MEKLGNWGFGMFVRWLSSKLNFEPALKNFNCTVEGSQAVA
jgi:hypothetical protein